MTQSFPTGAMDGFFQKLKENAAAKAAQNEARAKFSAMVDDKVAAVLPAYMNAVIQEAAHIKFVDVDKIPNYMDRCDTVREMNSAIRNCFEMCKGSQKLAGVIADLGHELGCVGERFTDVNVINGNIQYQLADDGGDDHQEERDFDRFVMYYSCEYFGSKCHKIFAAGVAKLWKSKITPSTVDFEAGSDYTEVDIDIHK